MAVTYPGTVTPLRGLAPFTEAERDVLFGRDRERDEVAHMVTADGFRAGLLYGEPGVGKTSLLRAGLLPHLHDHGITAVICEDPFHPAEALAHALAATGLQANPGEAPVAFLGRMVGNALPGQQFLFVLDDVDRVAGEDRHAAELGDLFQRVVSRSGGRARFLFVCASERVHLLGHVEKRTGSLFPPPARYELMRLAPTDAAAVIDRTLAFGGISADSSLVDALAQGLGRGGPVLPADIQIAALAVKELGIGSAAGLAKIGGASELEGAWLHALGRATGNERSGLRMIAELAAPDPHGESEPRSADWVAARLSLQASYARTAFETLEARGLIVPVGHDDPPRYALCHGVLAPRVREITAPARAAARRAYDLLGSKTQSRERLTLGELRALRAEAIAPMTPGERAVVDRSRRFYVSLAALTAAVPVIALVLVYVSLRGHAYLDVDRRAGGERVVVRAGRPNLAAFFWMPASPSFGDVVADTGMSRAMVAPAQWSRLVSQDIGGDLAGWDRLLAQVLEPRLANLVDYATTGNEAAVEALGKRAVSTDDKAELLAHLRPIARGVPAEVALVESALKDTSPAVQQAAVAVAGAAAQRRPDVYQDTLVRALTSADPELRRIAFTAVRGLGEERARGLFAAALARDPDAAARRELLVEVSTAAPDETAAPDASVSVLSDADAPAPMRERARAQLRRAFAGDAAKAAAAVAPLIGNEEAPAEERAFAIGLVLSDGPTPPGDAITAAVRTAVASRSERARAAALPLLARADPEKAAADLTPMVDDKKLPRPLREAVALAWGELARNKHPAAEAALDKLLGDDSPDVRAAAAAAYGNLGRVAQERLTKMARTERYDVATGAAEGLANSAEVGASMSAAVDGIYQLWKLKGSQRRQAARIFARLARRRPAAVVNYLINAARSTEDEGLHPIGVEGLCAAAAAGSSDARRALAKVADNPSVEVRRRVIRCVAQDPDAAKNGPGVAARLLEDPDPSIRAEAARMLAAVTAKGGKLATPIGKALLQRVLDADRNVRLIAARALAGLGGELPDRAEDTLTQAFERADEGEKLALLRAARAVGVGGLVPMGIADPSPLVRIEAVDTALGTGTRAAETVSAALADADPQVRRAALARIGQSPDKLEAAAIERALALGVRDPDPDLRQLALTTLARVGNEEVVKARLARSLAARAERERAQAAAAAIGLVERRPKVVVELLTPLLADPSHDVRVALLPSLAAAWAKVHSPEELARLLRTSEEDAMKRLAATAAFVTLAHSTPASRGAADSTLTTVADRGPTLARRHARLALGLIAGGADGLAFLQELVP